MSNFFFKKNTSFLLQTFKKNFGQIDKLNMSIKDNIDIIIVQITTSKESKKN